MSALISVIIPVYNVERYIRRCVDSILRQTYSHLEIILVDDESPDNCPLICDEYAKLDNRIKVIHKQKNGGLGMARNTGLDACHGEFIMFVDSDDWLSDDAIFVLYERLLLDGSDVAFGKHTDVFENGNMNEQFCTFMKDIVLSKEQIYKQMGKYPVSACVKLYKRELLNGISYPGFKCGEDLYTFLAIMDRCTKISIVDKIIYYYFQNADSITHRMSEQSKQDEVKVLLYTVDFLAQKGYIESARWYYAKCISKTLLLDNITWGLVLFKKHFKREVRRNLLRNQNLKICIKYFLMYFPVVYKTFRRIKDL